MQTNLRADIQRLRRSLRAGEALALLEKAIGAEPDFPKAATCRGELLLDLGRPAEALASFTAAVADDERDVAALAGLGMAHAALGQHAEAMALLDQALALDPGFAPALSRKGSLLGLAGQHEAARQLIDAALAADPHWAPARFNSALLHLQQGDFSRGWREYEARRRLPSWTDRRLAGAEWDGSPPRGKRLVFHAEQGFGDTIQFARFAARVAAVGATVMLQVPAELQRLLHSLRGVAIYRLGAALPTYDAHLPLLSLPHVLGLAREEQFAAAPYLRADAAEVARWRTRLGPAGAPRLRRRIGLVWRGNPKFTSDRGRSVPPAALRPLLHDGVEWISLQQGLHAEEAAVLAGTVRDFSADLRDFADTAALIDCLDLVITVDTSVAHLAGALGKPVWIMLGTPTDWRWGLQGERSQWYPRARLFRQSEPGDWAGPIGAIRAALDAGGAAPGRQRFWRFWT